MKKILTIFALTGFVAIVTYLLLTENEKSMLKKTSQKIAVKRPARELKPHELQKARIEAESIIKFQNVDTKETFELNELEMENKKLSR